MERNGPILPEINFGFRDLPLPFPTEITRRGRERERERERERTPASLFPPLALLLLHPSACHLLLYNYHTLNCT